MTRFNFRLLNALAISFIAAHCAQGTNGTQLAGKFKDTFTVQHDISGQNWNLLYPGVGTCERKVLNFDHSGGHATYVEGSANCPNPGKYGKMFFENESANVHWICAFLSGKATADEVENDTERPDGVSPVLGGCNGKAWSKLTPVDNNFALLGSFTDNWGGSQSYTNTLWTGSYGTPCTYAIIFYDNANGYFIYQQQADAGCTVANNYKFGKVFWGVDAASKLYYCELLYAQASYLTVANSTAKPTYGNPSATGCSGFSWTQLIR